MRNGHDERIPLSKDYVPGGTYPADVCVLRYALERHARTKPDETFAVFEGGERWTFAQTLEQVESLAGNLHELGVRQHDHVVLVLPTCPLALRVMFAANYLGAVYVPVNPALKGSSLQHVLHNAGAKIAVVHDSVLDRVLEAAPETLKTVIRTSDGPVAHREGVDLHGVSALTKPSSPPPAPPKPIQPWDTQSIIYTSGTTGRSKGVLSSYMHAFSCVGPDAWNCLKPSDRQMVHMPIFHIGGAFIATVSLVRWQLDRRGQPFPHRGLLGPGARARNHLRVPARRDGDVSVEAAAEPAGSRPRAAHGLHRAARPERQAVPRAFRRRVFHVVQHDGDLHAADLPRQPAEGQYLRTAARRRRGTPGRRARLPRRGRQGRAVDPAHRGAMGIEPWLQRQSAGDQRGLAQRLVSHRRRVLPRRRRRLPFRRPPEGRDPPPRREHLVL